MNTYQKIYGTLVRACIACLAALMLASCDTSEITARRGKRPDREQLENTYGMLRSTRTPGPQVTVGIAEGGGTHTENIYYRVSRPSQGQVSLTASADMSLVDGYNTDNGTSFAPLPAGNISFASGGAITIPAGERQSGNLAITFSADGLAPGEYLLPVRVSENTGITSRRDAVYYRINVRELSLGDYPVDQTWMTVYYVDVSEAQPILADYCNYEIYDFWTFELIETVTLGNIVNLRSMRVGYNENSKRALLDWGNDMRYVLEHADKYIRPLQDKGRKVCICIQGGGSGLGFCNMNDSQIADFASQVAAVVREYGIDGVNLWDEDAGYGKAGMPAVNTTSYPKLIKALREALPAEALLTLVDKDDPTATFHDSASSGGIAVGEYIDYAWPGYFSKTEGPKFVYPWDPDPLYGRKPIAGLSPQQYGNFMIPCYETTDYIDNAEWVDVEDEWGYVMEDYCCDFELASVEWANQKRQNNIIVFGDLITSATSSSMTESAYTGTVDTFFQLFYILDITTFDMDFMPLGIDSEIFRRDGYGTFGKDW